MRSTPMPFGTIITSLGYGERVDVLAEQDAWYKVRSRQSGQEGWMHSASLLDKKVKLSAGEAVEAAASEDELALGGKGFNAQVEAEYKRRDTGAAYEWVDWMEEIEVPAPAMQKFMAQGDLQPTEVSHEK